MFKFLSNLFKNNNSKENTKKQTPSWDYPPPLNPEQVSITISPLFAREQPSKITVWNVKEGDIVQAGQVICEVESNIVLMELEANYAGKIVELHPINQTLTADTVICKIIGV